jgi:hypothetical protein
MSRIWLVVGLALVISALSTTDAPDAVASHYPFWTHDQPISGASFWGFASTSGSESFPNPSPDQGQTDPVNVLFAVDNASSAVLRASAALQAADGLRPTRVPSHQRLCMLTLIRAVGRSRQAKPLTYTSQ